MHLETGVEGNDTYIIYTAVRRHALGDYRETVDHFFHVFRQFVCVSMTRE